MNRIITNQLIRSGLFQTTPRIRLTENILVNSRDHTMAQTLLFNGRSNSRRWLSNQKEGEETFNLFFASLDKPEFLEQVDKLKNIDNKYNGCMNMPVTGDINNKFSHNLSAIKKILTKVEPLREAAENALSTTLR